MSDRFSTSNIINGDLSNDQPYNLFMRYCDILESNSLDLTFSDIKKKSDEPGSILIFVSFEKRR